MSITKITEPFTGTTFFTAETSGVFYRVPISLTAGVYEVTCVSTTIATVVFWNGGTFVAQGVTVSGVATIDVGSTVTHIMISIDTGTDVSVGLIQTGITQPVLTGVLDTISATGSYTAASPGIANVLILGGGGGGGTGVGALNGGGGSASFASIGEYTLTPASVAVVVGAGGAVAGDGGTTTFDGVSALGGIGATSNVGGAGGSGGGGGTTSSPAVAPGGANGNPGNPAGGGGGAGGAGSGTTWASGVYVHGVSAGAGGAGGTRTLYLVQGGGGGGIYGGGGGGNGYSGTNSGGGGGGGGVPGVTAIEVPTAGGSGTGGVGGAGRIFVLRWSS